MKITMDHWRELRDRAAGSAWMMGVLFVALMLAFVNGEDKARAAATVDIGPAMVCEKR